MNSTKTPTFPSLITPPFRTFAILIINPTPRRKPISSTESLPHSNLTNLTTSHDSQTARTTTAIMIYLRPYFMDKPISTFSYKLDEISFTLLQILTFLVISGFIGRFVYTVVTGLSSGYIEMVKEVEKAHAFWNRHQAAVAEETTPQKTQQDVQLGDMQLKARELERSLGEIKRQLSDMERGKSEVLQKKKTQEVHRKKAEAEKLDHVLIERKELEGWTP